MSSVTRSPIDLPDCARAREKRTVDGRLGLKGRASGMKPVPDRTPDSERMGGGWEREEERRAEDLEEGEGEGEGEGEDANKGIKVGKTVATDPTGSSRH